MHYSSAVQDFRRARRRADMEQLLAQLRGQSAELLSYDEIRQELNLTSMTPRGLQEIPLDAIVGSVGRYNDFTRSFLPRHDSNAQRWARVKQATESLVGTPPIEVYKLGEAYFVLDGNHRVSVARQMGNAYIQAYVTEVHSKIPLQPNDQPDDIIIRARYLAFLEATGLNRLRPEADLTVTAPGQYRVLENHIRTHQYFMGLDQQRDISFEEAVAHWYDTVYAPVVQVIRRQNLLHDFPDRTETDLYLWLSEHQIELQRALEWEIGPEAAAGSLINSFSQKPDRVAGRIIDRLVDMLMPDELEAGPAAGQWRRERLEPRADSRLLTSLLVPISGGQSGWFALEQAIEVARYEEARILGLHVVPTEGSKDDPKALEARDEFYWRCQAAHVKGQFSIEQGEIARRIGQRAHWADLVVMYPETPPSSNPLTKLQSRARAIIRRWPRPVLTVRDQISAMDRLVLAYDDSPKAREALFVATYMAERWGSNLHVISVAGEGGVNQNTLQKAKTYLQDHDIDCQATLLQGKQTVAGQIMAYAHEHERNVILIGGYGRQPMLEVVLGSVVDHLLREWTLPLLICR